MKKHSRSLSIFILLILCFTLIGCKSAKESNSMSGLSLEDGSNTYGMGRYVEKVYHPSCTCDYWFLNYHVVPENSSMFKDDCVTLTIPNYICSLGSDGQWTQEPISLWVPEEKGLHLDYLRFVIGEDNNEYVLVRKFYQHYYIFKKTGSTLEQVTISSLDELTNNHSSSNLENLTNEPCDFTVTAEGDIVLMFPDNVQYIKKDGTLGPSWYNINGYASIVVADKLYALADTFDTLNIYNLKSGDLENSISTKDLSLNKTRLQVAVLAKDCNNTIYLQCSKGIYQLSEDTTTFTQIVDGALNSMGSGTELPHELYVDTQGNFLSVRSDLQYSEWTICQYTYDPEVPTYPDKQLNVYSLYENPEIRAAIVKYQKENPNILVNFYVAINPEDKSNMQVQDCVQELNTQLLANNGPDIIFLDGLNIKNFIDKGILADITEQVEEISDVNDVIKHTFTNNGKIFAFPCRINIPVIAGMDDAMLATNSLQELATYSQNSSKTLIGSINLSDFVDFLYPAYKNEILNEDQTIALDKLSIFLTNLKTIYDHTVITEKDYYPSANSLYNIKYEQANVGLGLLCDARTISEALHLCNRADKSMSCLNRTYIPMSIFSINKNTSQKEEALDLLRVLLSEEIQKNDFFTNGIAVNEKLHPHKSIYNDPYHSKYMCMYPYYDLEQILHNEPIHFSRKEIAQQLYRSLFNEIQTPYIYDVILDDTIKGYIKDYLSGDLTLDEEVSKFNSFYSLYCAE